MCGPFLQTHLLPERLLKGISSSKRWLFAVLALFLANDLFLGLSTRRLSNRFGWVEHTFEVQSAIQQVQPDVIAFNRSVRNDWTTQEHPQAPASLSEALSRDADRIQQLTVDNASQQRHVTELRTLLANHAAIHGGIPFDPGTPTIGEQLDLSTLSITVLLKEMYAEETDLLQQRQDLTFFTKERILSGLIAEAAGSLLLTFLMLSYYTRQEIRDAIQEKAIREAQAQLALEQELREKRIEALSHMAGGLAHEISNPLAIMHALASDLVDIAKVQSSVPAEKVLKSSESIVRTADRASKILRGLRGFGREAAQDPREPASIYEIVDQCVDIQQARFERHQIDLRVDLEPGIAELLCREVQIGQIITNLLNNAFDAIHQAISPISSERWISLHAEPLDQGVLIDVSDSGPAIEEKYRAHLLEPFFTTKKHGLGTGIGLSLSRAIAQDHGGSLVLLENASHTCFRLVLPGDCEIGRPPSEAKTAIAVAA